MAIFSEKAAIRTQRADPPGSIMLEWGFFVSPVAGMECEGMSPRGALSIRHGCGCRNGEMFVGR